MVGCSQFTRTVWHQFKSLVVQNGVLYRKFEHPCGLPEKQQLQLVLPPKHKEATIKSYHEQLGVGNHFGISKTTAYAQKFFWWPGMHNDITSVITNCLACNRFKKRKPVTKVHLKLFQDGALHGRWHVDICGPFKKTKEDYKFALVAVESFSGWPVVVPLKTQKAEEIAEALITHVFSIYGSPQSIMTDRGTSFESSLFQEIMNLYNIKKYRTTTYHPAANGKAERWIKTLKDHLGMLVEEAQEEWPKYLPFIAQAYRSLPHTAHKFSPYEVMFGAPMRTPLDMVHGQFPMKISVTDDYPYKVRQILHRIHDLVRKMNHTAAIRMKQYYDRNASLSPLQPGDIVLLYTNRRQKCKTDKLSPRWEGPFTVLDIINDCNARIQGQDAPYDKSIVHIEKLMAYPGLEVHDYTDYRVSWLTFC